MALLTGVCGRDVYLAFFNSTCSVIILAFYVAGVLFCLRKSVSSIIVMLFGLSSFSFLYVCEWFCSLFVLYCFLLRNCCSVWGVFCFMVLGGCHLFLCFVWFRRFVGCFFVVMRFFLFVNAFSIWFISSLNAVSIS